MFYHAYKQIKQHNNQRNPLHLLDQTQSCLNSVEHLAYKLCLLTFLQNLTTTSTTSIAREEPPVSGVQATTSTDTPTKTPVTSTIVTAREDITVSAVQVTTTTVSANTLSRSTIIAI